MNYSPYSTETSNVGATETLTGNPARDLANSLNVRVILFLLLHIPLAMLMELSPWVSTAHAVLVLLYALGAGLTGRSSRVIYAVAYIGSCEVLWRMSQAHLVWEYAKYALVVVIFVAIVVEWRINRNSRRIRTLSPVLFMLALMPGAVLTLLSTDLNDARDSLSFNLAGHLAIAMLALYLWARPVNREVTYRLLLAIIAPVVGITFLAVYYTVRSLDTLEFVAASNWITSGSYGPNQVSNMMGLGALVGTMLLITMPKARGAKFIILIGTLVMLGQGLLTFSRGGIYSFVLALAVFGIHLLSNRRARTSFLALFALFAVLLVAGVYPFLDQFTSGTLSERFSDIDTTGRLELAQIDLQVFLENPFAGVGVGQAATYNQGFFGVGLAAHTEFTRLLAEHGLFGIVALFILTWMAVKRYHANERGLGRAMTAALVVWALSVMLHSAMRLAAIPLTYSLALVLWQLPQTVDIELPSISARITGQKE